MKNGFSRKYGTVAALDLRDIKASFNGGHGGIGLTFSSFALPNNINARRDIIVKFDLSSYRRFGAFFARYVRE